MIIIKASMLFLFLPALLTALSLLSPIAGVVYYVKPTEPFAHNSSCPSNETCHTMDHYASNSSHYFSPDHINVTLYFMCGVHNFTKRLDLRDLKVFSMIGTAEKQYVTIIMPIPREILNNPRNISSRTYNILFANVSIVSIESATVYFISLSFEGKRCLFVAKEVNFHGYIGPLSPMVSFINITGSEAMLKNCIFQNNCFVRIHSQAILTVTDCVFHSYNHVVYSSVALDNSTVTLAGSISFINNSVGNDEYYTACGGAFSLRNSVFNTSAGARVTFIYNLAVRCGGALFMRSTLMSVSSNVNMTFMSNHVTTFYYSLGAGGAIYTEKSTIMVDKAVLLFANSFANQGGALHLLESSVFISGCKEVLFINNTAQYGGGAVYLFNTSEMFVDAHSRLMFYNNSARQGGALHLQTLGSIRVNNNSQILFSHNFAENYGGAIFTDDQRCIFVFSSYSSTALFEENSAKQGVGNHIYGSSVKTCMNSFCFKDIVSYMPNITNSLSPVSSSPMRVCLCDRNGRPQCVKLSSILSKLYKVYRGELFNISIVLVGYDFGVTTGAVSAGFLPSNGYSTPTLGKNQRHQLLKSGRHCSNITYSVFSKNVHEVLYLYTSEVNELYINYGVGLFLMRLIDDYKSTKQRCANLDLFKIPVFINITLLNGCPPGFILSFHDRLYGCNYFPILQSNNFICIIIHNTGYLKWNSTIWVNATFKKCNKNDSNCILFAQHCPLNNCRKGEKLIDLGSNPDAQCDFNHSGVLCGGCKNNYSLAIGSSRCIRCSNNNFLPFLFIPFGVAGVLLVTFILLLNLTVTQGLVNGLIFYANILWTYKDVLFPPEQRQKMLAFQWFVAWLNLDFGIETCFIFGLTAFWKTWLQFLFPLYIWLIAVVIIIACRHSSRLTRLIGDRAVPLLATLFLLSYTKLLRTLMTILEFRVLTHYSDESKTIVWYLDGNLLYCQYPHIYLFIVAMVVLIFLCLPFTLLLLLIQCWRRISHLWLLRWINKFTPFYDAYFSPLKNKHHYWFGTLLLIRGVFLIIFMAMSSTRPLVSLLILAMTLVMLQFYISIMPVYKSKVVRLFESASLSNLLFLICYKLYNGDLYSGTTALQISIGFAFIQFLLIILISAIKICYHKYKCITQSQDSSDNDMVHERVNDPDINTDILYYPIRNITDTY